MVQSMEKKKVKQEKLYTEKQLQNKLRKEFSKGFELGKKQGVKDITNAMLHLLGLDEEITTIRSNLSGINYVINH